MTPGPPERAAVDPAPGPARKPFAGQCTRVYTYRGGVAHLLSPTSTIMGGDTLCPVAPSWPDVWRGTGSQAEHELAASLPLCKTCEKRARAEDEYYSEPSQWRDPAPPDPAAESPVSVRVAQAPEPGEPTPSVPPAEGEGGKTSPHCPCRAAADAGIPDPVTGADSERLDAPGRVRSQAPAGGGQRRAADAPLAGLHKIAAAMTEAELEEHVRELCKGLGILRIHVYNSRGTTPGVPDDVLIGPRGVLWRELKTMRGKVTPAQRAMGEALHAAGQDWAVWRPDYLLSGGIALELAALAGLRAGAA